MYTHRFDKPAHTPSTLLHYIPMKMGVDASVLDMVTATKYSSAGFIWVDDTFSCQDYTNAVINPTENSTFNIFKNKTINAKYYALDMWVKPYASDLDVFTIKKANGTVCFAKLYSVSNSFKIDIHSYPSPVTLDAIPYTLNTWYFVRINSVKGSNYFTALFANLLYSNPTIKTASRPLYRNEVFWQA
jgi:hypothetical protein